MILPRFRDSLSGIFYGWRMVGLVTAIRIVGGGLHQFGFTVFFLPISQDLGISRAATSLAFSLSRAHAQKRRWWGISSIGTARGRSS